MKFQKKIISIIMTMLLLISAVNPVFANNNITVKLDGHQIAFDVQPQIINSRTMVPLRAIFEALGATVDWNGDTQTVTSTKGGTTISLTINNPTMYVNGAAVTLDSPACLVGGRTLVPVRAISEAFGTIVDWDGATSTVDIKTSNYKEVTWYSDNMYRVGTDIPAGDYYAVITNDKYSGYYCKYKDSTQSDIEYNDNFKTFTFFRCYDGQYLKLSGCKITPIENAPVYNSPDGIYGNGTYRVGIDIPAGEYKFLPTDSKYSGYYCVYSDITYNDIKNNDNFDGTAYYTIYNGQYLKINSAVAQKIGEIPSSNNNSGSSSEMKMYDGFEGVPDFGAFANIATVETGSTTEGLFTYRASDAVASKGSKVLTEYSQLLLDLGFESSLINLTDSGIYMYSNPDTGINVSIYPPTGNFDRIDIVVIQK